MWLAPCGIAAPHTPRKEKQRAKTKDLPIPVPLVADELDTTAELREWRQRRTETGQMKCP